MSIKPIPDFDKLGSKAYLFVLVLILFIVIIVFKDYFFAKLYLFKTLAFNDTYTQLYPYEYLRADYIAKYGIPKWSFSVGMGQSLFQFFLHDPFDIFLDITGKDHFLYYLAYKEMAKIVLGGLIFFFYLKTLKLSDYTSIIGSLLFAFCGFMIMGNGWYIHSFEVFTMAILLLAFELLFNKQNWYLFPLPFFLMGLSMPFNLYLYGSFIAFYAVLRHLQTGAFNFKKLGSLFLKMGGFAMVGILLSGPFLIENTMGLLASPRVGGNSSYLNNLSSTSVFRIINSYELRICLMRFFSNEVLGVGEGNAINWPMFYCGLPCLLLTFQVFQFLNKRMRLIFIVVLTIWMLPLFFPYLRYAFWLFSGDYYRGYSFFVAFIILYYSLQALEHILKLKKINRIVLITTLVILLAIIIYYTFFDIGAYNPKVSFFIIGMLIIYGALLFFIPEQKNTVYFKCFF